MNEKSIGLIELSSVAAGFEVADTMLKAGDVRLLLSRSICSGKFMVSDWRRCCCGRGCG